MEKSSSEEHPLATWQKNRIVTRHIYDGKQQTQSGGVLYARRRSFRRTVDLVIALFLLGSIACVVLSMSLVTRTVQGWHRPAPAAVVAAAAAPAPTEAPPVGKKTILLLGSDQRPDDGSFRTDVILFITIDSDQKTVSVVSFPRDLWVSVPDYYEMKITGVQMAGGFETTANMFESNFGIRPNYFLMTNFQNFTAIIDSLGGVDIEIAQELTDDCDLPQAIDGDCTVVPGITHMDGPTALWYVRSRYTTSDFDRMRRMQEVAYAIFKKMMSMNAIARLPELYQIYSQNVETNLRLQDIIPLIPVATEVLTDTSRIHRYAINEEVATPSYSWDGQWILLPDQEAIHQLLIEAGAVPGEQ